MSRRLTLLTLWKPRSATSSALLEAIPSTTQTILWYTSWILWTTLARKTLRKPRLLSSSQIISRGCLSLTSRARSASYNRSRRMHICRCHSRSRAKCSRRRSSMWGSSSGTGMRRGLFWLRTGSRYANRLGSRWTAWNLLGTRVETSSRSSSSLPKKSTRSTKRIA